MKKILFLGAAKFQTPPIIYALECGYHVITCDNRSENPGHQLAHQSFDVSTTDQEKILKLALDLSIDGIVAFGSDVSAPTAAFVAESLRLPGPSYKTVLCLTKKHLFREFLNQSQLQLWNFQSFKRSQKNLALEYCHEMSEARVIKPVDSSGSKGVTIARKFDEVELAVERAFSESLSGEILIESLFERNGPQVCGDGYMEDGKLKFVQFGDGHFYSGDVSLAPYAETFPSTHSQSSLNKLKQKIETILSTAGYLRGPFNLDCLINSQGEPFVIEIGPRTGGNYIPTAIRYYTGTDLIAATVESALDPKFKLEVKQSDGHTLYACYMIHSHSHGILKSIEVHPEISQYIIEENPYLSPGAEIFPFKKANAAIGNVILKFPKHDQMLEIIKNMPSYLKPILEKKND